MLSTQKLKIELVLSFRSDCLNDCTALLVRPFDDGWYSGDKRCLIPFQLKNDSNSALVMFWALADQTEQTHPKFQCLMISQWLVNGTATDQYPQGC